MASYLSRSWILLLLGITLFSRIDTAESFFGFGGGYGPGYGYGGGYGQGYGYGGGYGYGYDDYDDYMPEEYEHGHHHAPYYHAHNRPLGLLYGYNY